MNSTIRKIPKVSIGMPVYNGEKYIKDAIDSLLLQSFVNFELIISNNASTDQTEAICLEYEARDKRIRYVRQPQNKGAVANFKFVLDLAVGEYFMWAAHDDIWDFNYLMQAIELMVEEDIDFVFPSFELRSIGLGVSKKFDPKIFHFIESSDRIWRILNFMSLHFMSHSANIVYSLFRKDFVKHIWDIQDIGNDGVFGLAILSHGRGKINKALFSKRYRMIWPGMIPSIVSILKGLLQKRDVEEESAKAIAVARLRILNLFPELKHEIKFIYDQYQPYVYDKNYRVCSINGLYNSQNFKKSINMNRENIPSVSIGMPVFNGEKFINEALNSILSQTFTDFELIISDNASTDRTEIICREYELKDKRIRYIRQTKNEGSMANFQFVLDAAIGKYFMWAAADDTWSLTWIETLLQILRTNTNTAGFGKVLTIDENSNIIEHPTNNRAFNFVGNKLLRRLKYFFELESLGKANIIYSLFRLQDIKKINFNKFEFDYNINYFLLHCIQFKCSNEATIYKRLHSNNEGGESTVKKSRKKSIMGRIINFILAPITLRKMFLLGYFSHSSQLEIVLLSVLYPLKMSLMYFAGIKKIVISLVK